MAELLARYVPMLQALGIQADWRLIHGELDSLPSPNHFTMPCRVGTTICGSPSRNSTST